MKLSIEYISPILTKIGIATILIMAATQEWDYDYYIILKWVVLTAFFYLAYNSFTKKNMGLMILFIAIALFFNPIIKTRIDQEIWIKVDWAVATIAAVSILFDLKSNSI